MDSRKRIMEALSLRQPDKVPIFELYINESSLVNLSGHLGIEAKIEAKRDKFGQERTGILDLYCEIVENLGLDATSLNHSIGLEQVTEDLVRDKFGTVYELSEHGEPIPKKAAIKELFDIKGFDMASKLEREDFYAAEYVISRINKIHFMCVSDPFKLSWRLRGGMENLLIDYMLNPELVHSLAEITTQYDMAVIDLAKEIGADVIIVPGDLGAEHTTIISPEHYREYLKPYHSRLVDYAHKKGMKIVKHSDGNVWPILDDFIEVGFDGFHPVQPQCMNIGEVKKHLRLSGNYRVSSIHCTCPFLLPQRRL